ncbi:MAG: hypothetical protein GXP57_01580, partial [Deltaproteobacteria bacterium]|nr:hypothetical protein [Deltaproteobacteria bacterium]
MTTCSRQTTRLTAGKHRTRIERTMYLDHFNLNKSPFREEPDPVFFFQEAGRIDTLLALLRDIEGGKPLIKLVGREGTGKTLFGLLLTHRLPAGYDIVRLDNPAGSFEELLYAI